MQTDEKVFSVSEISLYIKNAVQSVFPYSIKIRGELTNITLSRSGHLYFDIKDENSSISATLFKNNMRKVSKNWDKIDVILPLNPDKITLEQGKEIIIEGSLGTYARASRYQINVINILTLDKTGALHKKYLILRDKLEKEGYFEKSHKKPIPLYPSRIAIVTSAHGAAVKDILDVLSRFPFIKTRLFPVMVQGDRAGTDIADKLRMINEKYPGRYDLIITGRGGGSYEDLFCFNDEDLVKAVYESCIPVISAVGHERDMSLTDFAADFSAITPTAAGQKAISGYLDAVKIVESSFKRIKSHASSLISNFKSRIVYLSGKRIRLLLINRINTRYQHLDAMFSAMIEKSLKSRISDTRHNIRFYLKQGIQNSLKNRIISNKQSIDILSSSIRNTFISKQSAFRLSLNKMAPDSFRSMIKNLIAFRRQNIKHRMDFISGLSPKNLLIKGYSITMDEKGRIIRKTGQVSEGQIIKTMVSDGTIESNTLKIKEEDNFYDKKDQKIQPRI